MNQSPITVDVLRRVGLSLAAGSAEGRSDILPGPAPFDFIFGIGTDGITPFEYRLVHKLPGDHIEVMVTRNDLSRLFGHLAPQVLAALPIPARLDRWWLSVAIEAVNAADGRDVVRALARLSEAAEGGCGCTGGCGGGDSNPAGGGCRC
jgi:hypothetical protein